MLAGSVTMYRSVCRPSTGSVVGVPAAVNAAATLGSMPYGFVGRPLRCSSSCWIVTFLNVEGTEAPFGRVRLSTSWTCVPSVRCPSWMSRWMPSATSVLLTLAWRKRVVGFTIGYPASASV